MKKKYLVFGFLVSALLLWGIVINGDLNVIGTLTATVVDFTSSTSTAPMKSGTSLPSTCSVGQAFFKTDATAGQNIYLCTSNNTWTQVQGSGGSGTWNQKPNPRYISLVTDFSTMNYAQAHPISAGDFILNRQVGSNYISGSGSGSMSSALPVGVAAIITSATANSREGWSLNYNSLGITSGGNSLYALTTYNWEYVIIFRYPASTDYTNSNLVVGVMEATNSDPNRGLGVRFLSGTDTNFTFYTSNTMGDGYTSTLSTGVAPDTNWHKLKIRSDGTTAYRIYMSFDNGTEVSVCQSGCDLTASATNSYLWGSIGFYIRTLEAAAKRLHLDYAHFWADLGSSR